MFGLARRLGVAIVVVVLLGGATLVTWDRSWRRAGPANPGYDCHGLIRAGHRLPFSAIGVHRVALIGDSIMFQASCAAAQELAGVGITTTRHGAPGSGLLAGGDWIAETRKILRTEHPDAVVAVFVGNYIGEPARDSRGNIIENDTPEFFRAWQARAQLLSAAVHAAHARMYWVSPPPIDTDPLLHNAQRLFDGYRSIPGDHVLMSGSALAGPGGREIMTKRTCGHVRVIRTPERVHLTFDGARIYGQQIAHDLTAGLGVFVAPRPC